MVVVINQKFVPPFWRFFDFLAAAVCRCLQWMKLNVANGDRPNHNKKKRKKLATNASMQTITTATSQFVFVFLLAGLVAWLVGCSSSRQKLPNLAKCATASVRLFSYFYSHRSSGNSNNNNKNYYDKCSKLLARLRWNMIAGWLAPSLES